MRLQGGHRASFPAERGYRAMRETTDYNSIRSVAYFIPAMLFVMAVRVGVSAMTVHPQEGLSGMTLFRAVGGFPLACMLIEYILGVVCFVFLYRLAETTVWIDVASTMFLCFISMEVLVRAVEWIDYRLDPGGMTGAGVLAVSEIPLIFILLGVVFLINGMTGFYRGIRENSEKEVKSCQKIRSIWTAGVILLMMAKLLLELFILQMKNEEATFVRYLSLAFAFLFLLSVIPLTLRLRSFCYEFYMYCYNRRR